MKSLIPVLCLFILIPLPLEARLDPEAATCNQSLDYDSGWQSGYVAGWRHVKGANAHCRAPRTPRPKYGRETYQDGWEDGFVAGRLAAGG